MKILVADDQPMYRRLARAALEPAGHEVIEVTDGGAAWSLIEGDTAPAVVLLDWMMPGLTGLQVCRKVRERAALRAPHLILVTGHGKPADIVEGLAAGADDYITKPFNPAELRARVAVGARILELRSALAARVASLESALAQVKHLQGLLPICAWCKRIRNDQNYWQAVDVYVAEHSDARFTHGICPACRAATIQEERERLAEEAAGRRPPEPGDR